MCREVTLKMVQIGRLMAQMDALAEGIPMVVFPS